MTRVRGLALLVALLVLSEGATLHAQVRDPWAWWVPATVSRTMQVMALQAFRTELQSMVPQDFLEPGVLDRELLLSIVTRGAADLTFDELRELKTKLDELKRTNASPGR